MLFPDGASDRSVAHRPHLGGGAVECSDVDALDGPVGANHPWLLSARTARAGGRRVDEAYHRVRGVEAGRREAETGPPGGAIPRSPLRSRSAICRRGGRPSFGKLVAPRLCRNGHSRRRTPDRIGSAHPCGKDHSTEWDHPSTLRRLEDVPPAAQRSLANRPGSDARGWRGYHPARIGYSPAGSGRRAACVPTRSTRNQEVEWKGSVARAPST
jgi:hypothetical protein